MTARIVHPYREPDGGGYVPPPAMSAPPTARDVIAEALAGFIPIACGFAADDVVEALARAGFTIIPPAQPPSSDARIVDKLTGRNRSAKP